MARHSRPRDLYIAPLTARSRIGPAGSQLAHDHDHSCPPRLLIDAREGDVTGGPARLAVLLDWASVTPHSAPPATTELAPPKLGGTRRARLRASVATRHSRS
jgi:hypothetical protein